MSGEKKCYVSVEEQELRRLKEQDSRLKTVQRDLPERLNKIRQDSRQELQQRLAPLEQRARQQEHEVQKLQSGLSNLEKDTQRRLQQQRQEFQNSLHESENRQQQALIRETSRLEEAMRQGLSQQRSEYLRITSEQRQEYLKLNQQIDQKFTQLIAEERQAREQGQQILQQQINQVFDSIEQEKQYKAKLAQDLLGDVEVIWRQIEGNYQHERFAPGKLADLQRNIELARNNIQAGVTEAAIATAQQTYLALADLRLELEQKEQEWLLYYNATLGDLRSLIAEVQANRECEVEVGEEDEAEKFRLEVDYWVNGLLSQHELELNNLQAQLKTKESTLTTEEIKQIGEKINNLQPRLGEIIEQAKLEILGSQLRVEIADKVVEVLGAMGYTLVNADTDAIYESMDQRNAYVVKVKNIAGDEVVTVISPEKDFGSNSVSINTFSQKLLDEKVTQQNAKAIFDILETEGVKGTAPLECRQQPKQEYQNMQQVRQPKKQSQA